MKKLNILKSNEEFNRIISNYKPIHFKNFVIYIEKTKEESYKFGFSVSKKIGHAVVRNKIKRQMKNIIDKKQYEKGFNCIIIVRKSILNMNFIEMKEELFEIVEKINIVKGDKNEK